MKNDSDKNNSGEHNILMTRNSLGPQEMLRVQTRTRDGRPQIGTGMVGNGMRWNGLWDKKPEYNDRTVENQVAVLQKYGGWQPVHRWGRSRQSQPRPDPTPSPNRQKNEPSRSQNSDGPKRPREQNRTGRDR